MILPKNSTHTIIERRSKVVILLAEGKTQVQIASLLNVSPQLIHDDIKAIERDAQKYILENVSKNTAYLLYISMGNILRVNREAWKIYQDKKTTLRDKINSLKVSISASQALQHLAIEGFNYQETYMTNIELQHVIDDQNKHRMDYPVIPLVNEESEVIDLEHSPIPSLTTRSDNDTYK
jgi:hypothetical protein